jgi:hypothetical protein
MSSGRMYPIHVLNDTCMLTMTRTYLGPKLSSMRFRYSLIHLKRIYNFWCSMLVLHHLLHVLFTLRGIFICFLELTYWWDATVPVPYFLLFCVSGKLHRKYSQNWTKRRPKLLFFPDEGWRPNESRREARGQPHPRVARPPSGHATTLWGPLVHLVMTPLRLYKVSQRKTLKWSAIF